MSTPPRPHGRYLTGPQLDDIDVALELASEAIRKIQRHIPNKDTAGTSLSADLDLCKRALAALGKG